MRTQTSRQKIGTAGHSIAQMEISLSEYWIPRNLTEDYGIDLELEYTAPKSKNSDTIVTGKFLKAQIRSHEKSDEISDLTEYIDFDFLRYAFECRIPIILILVSVETKECWCVWLQGYILENNLSEVIYKEHEKKKLGIKVPITDTLKIGLKTNLIEIAKWENHHQFYLAIKELANFSLKLSENKLTSILNDYLRLLGTDINSVINAVVDLGPAIWGTEEGHATTQVLYSYVRSKGKFFKADHLKKLVLRGEVYSRIGINALGILYDNFPEHVLTLNLPAVFREHDDPRPYYYCCLRERYIDKKTPEWFSLPTINFEIGNLTVPDECKSDIYKKWANRGDSAILDYLTINKG